MTVEYRMVNGHMHKLDMLVFHILQEVGAKG